MADKIRANYPAMEEMAKQMDLVTSRLNELTDNTGKIVDQMRAGVLLGDPGEKYTDALLLLAVKVYSLSGAVERQAKGIRAAMSDMQQADGSAAGDFK